MKNSVNTCSHKIHPSLWHLVYFIVPALVFGWIIAGPLPGFLRPLSFSLRVDLWPVIPITAIIIYLLFRIRGCAGELITILGVAIIFALPLAGLWAYGHTQSSVVSGVLQMNDARGYYTDALRLTIGENFSFFSSRRPLFPGFLSLLLVITNYNLMATLAAISAVTAISCYALTREVQKTHGTETAVFLLVMIFLYYRLHSGITMSENFGIAIGSLGFALLWNGAENKNMRTIGIGLFSTTLALNARAGAFFVLPFLVFWAGRLFRDTKFISWKAVFISSTAILLGFASNLMLGKLVGQPGGIPFANFSYTLYSLAAGGKSWAYIGEAHPEVFLLGEPEHTKKVFELALELIHENPYQAFQGAIFFWKAIFTDTLYNVFAFVAKENWVINPVIKWILYFLSTVGFLAWLSNKKSPASSLTIACAIGIFLSIPFAPATDSFRMRPYAASIAMISMIPALGFGYLINKIRLQSIEIDNSLVNHQGLTQYVNAGLIILIFLGPVLIKFTLSGPEIIPQNCQSEPGYVITKFTQGTYVNLMRNKETSTDWPPNYHTYLFQKNAHNIEDANLINLLETIKPMTTILVTLDASSKKDVLLVLPTELIPKNTGYFQLCGYFEDNPLLSPYSIFYASEVLPSTSQP